MGASLPIGIVLTADGGAAIGTLKLTRQEIEKLAAASKRAGKDVSDAGSGIQSFVQQTVPIPGVLRGIATAGGIATTVLVGMGVALTGAFAVSARATMEAEVSVNRLLAVLKATGYAAGLTANDLDDMATSMAAATRFDDEAIRDAQSVMLTFRQVQGDTFRQAIALSADLAEVFQTDLKSATMQVGKALQDPVEGLTALRRSGISFSETQKDVIEKLYKTGDVAGAQKVILRELADQVGGGATGVNSGLTKASSDLRKSWGEMLESIGNTPAVSSPAIGALSTLKSWLDKIRAAADGTNVSAIVANQLTGVREQLAYIERMKAPATSLGGLFAKAFSGGEGKARELRLELARLEKVQQGLADKAKARAGTGRPQADAGALAQQQRAAADRAATEAKEKAEEEAKRRKGGGGTTKVDAGRAFLDKLREQNETFGLGETAMLRYQAAQLKIAEAAEPAIRSLERKIAAEKEAIEAEERRLGATDAYIKKLNEEALADDDRLRALNAFKSANQEYLSDIEFETSLLGENTVMQRILTEQRSIDLKVKELSKNASAEMIGQLKAEAEATKAATQARIEMQSTIQRSAEFGKRSAFKEYLDEAGNAAEQTKRMWSNAFKSAEDALVNFTMTGKFNFKDFVRSILADWARVQAKKFLAGVLGGIFGGGKQAPAPVVDKSFSASVFHGGGIAGSAAPTRSVGIDSFRSANRYHGGGIASNEVPAVLKRGEGVFTEPQMKKLAPAGSGDVTVIVNVMSDGSTETKGGGDAANLGRMVGAVARQVIVDEKRHGGLLAEIA